MKPKAIRSLTMVRGTDGLLRLEMVDAGRAVVLDPLAELVWDLSDGSRSLEDLAQAAGRALDRVVPQEEVFSALDFLADAGLLEERVAPPVAEGKVSRRSLLVQMAPVVGAAAWMMSGASARAGGLFQESSSKESSSKESGKESSSKESHAKESHAKESQAKESQAKNSNTQDSSTGKRDPYGGQDQVRIVKDPGRIDDNWPPVDPNHPLVGKWKYVRYQDWAKSALAYGCDEACIEHKLVWKISSKGILEARYSAILRSYVWEAQTNWKYTSTGPGTGVLEAFQILKEFQGARLRWKGDIRWIGKNEFEYTTTLAPTHDSIGQRMRFVRDDDRREGIRSETRSESNSNENPSQYQERYGKNSDLQHSDAAPRVIAQKLCDQMDDAYANQDLNRVLGFADSSIVIIDERGRRRTLADLRRELERMFAESRRMNPRTIVEDVQLEGDRMVVRYKGEMHFELHGRSGGWIPMISEEAGEDTWQRKGDQWRLVRATIYRDDMHVDRNR